MFASKQDKQLKAAVAVMKRVVAGDFEARVTDITAGGDLGELLHTVNDLIDRCDAYVRESSACMEHVSRNEYYRKIVETGMQGAFLNAGRTVNGALDVMQDRVNDFAAVANDFEGSIGAVVETVATASDQLTQSSDVMERVASETSVQAGNVMGAAAQASSNVATVSAASEQLTSSITEIGQQIKLAARAAEDASGVSTEAAERVTALEDAAEQIVHVTSLISDIAAQTNLLALNATIEASRAGEAGKGFAVVAGEVKNLADQTSRATEEIGRYVQNIKDASETTVQGITEVSAKVGAISDATSAIAAAIDEQNSATSEILRNIEEAAAGASHVTSNIQQVNAAANETGGAAAQVRQAAHGLSEQSHSLQGAVHHFLAEVKKLA